MFGYSSLSAVVLVIVLCYSQAIEDEPTFSKVLETMVRMEAKMDQWNKERKTFEEKGDSLFCCWYKMRRFTLCKSVCCFT
jgi:hypothetical protein